MSWGPALLVLVWGLAKCGCVQIVCVFKLIACRVLRDGMEGGCQNLIWDHVPRVTEENQEQSYSILFQTGIRTGKPQNLSQKRYYLSQLLVFYERSYSVYGFAVVSVRIWLPLQMGIILSDFCCDLYSLFSGSSPRFYRLFCNVLVRHASIAVLLRYPWLLNLTLIGHYTQINLRTLYAVRTTCMLNVNKLPNLAPRVH